MFTLLTSDRTAAVGRPTWINRTIVGLRSDGWRAADQRTPGGLHVSWVNDCVLAKITQKVITEFCRHKGYKQDLLANETYLSFLW